MDESGVFKSADDLKDDFVAMEEDGDAIGLHFIAIILINILAQLEANQ